MAEQKIALTVEANVGSLRSQIKEATQEVIKLSQKFGEFSPEAINAAKRVAELKDQLKDARELTDALDPGKKFAAVSAAIRTVTGSFAALQGGLALFGVESAEVEKQLLKVQAALALSEGVSTILDAGKSFRLLGAIIKTQVISALTTLRGALIATGIGALAVGVGLLIANFEKVKEVALNLVPGLAKVGEAIGRLINKVKEFTGIAARERAAAEISAREAVEAREEEAAKKAAERAKEQAAEQARVNAEAARQRAAERERRRAEEEAAAKEEKQRREERNSDAYFDAKQTANDVAEVQNEAIQSTNLVVAGGTAQRLKILQDAFNEEKRLQFESADNAEAAAKLKIEKEYNVQRAVQATSQILYEASDLLGRQTAAGKVLAIASTTIDTIQSAQSVYKALSGIPVVGPALATAAAITASIAGLKRIQAIKNVQVPGQTGTFGGGIPSLPSNASAPLAAPSPTVGVTRLDAATVNNLGNKAVRAYVLETDITDQQTRQRRIERAAVLGG
jgi:hypothetical protein